MTFKFRVLSTSLALIGSLAGVTQAHADTATFSGYANGSQSVQATVTSPAGLYDSTLSAGGFSAIYNGIARTTYCVELYEPLSFGENYTNFKAVSGSVHNFANSKASDDIGRLFAQGNVVNDPTTEAAFQIAIWEMTYETSGKYDLNSGNAKFTGGTAATSGALALATNWLNGLSDINMSGRFAVSADGQVSYSTTVLENKGAQDQVLASRLFIDVVTAPVPEPETYALMAFGLLGIGFAARRRTARKN
jgi:hypothetical protein